MSEKLHIVLFSYNRAMQLDATLNSIYKYVQGVEISTSVLYHYSPLHRDSYDMLVEEWSEREGVAFALRLEGRSFLKEVFPLFFKYYRNALRYLRYKAARDHTYRFKYQFETLVKSSDARLTMMNTDDTLFYRTTYIPQDILSVIVDNPKQASYRMYVGANQDDCPLNLMHINGVLKWNYNDAKMYRHWTYPFAVDATVYATKGLHNILKSVLYYSPSSLEGNVCDYVKRRKLLSVGYSPLVRPRPKTHYQLI